MLGDPASMGMMDGGSQNEEARTASTSSVGRFESAGSAHAFDLDLGPLTSQPQGPHAVRTRCIPKSRPRPQQGVVSLLLQ